MRLRGLASWIALFALCLAPPASADLDRAINEAVREARRVSSQLGVHVVEIASGEEVYSFEADKERIIASNTKLFTTATALGRLGPEYFFETPVYVRGDLRGGVLHGDLGVVGGGDPNLSGRHHDGDSLAVFRIWAEKLKERGIERIEGDVYLAHGLFTPPRVHPDWPRDQLSRWYEAPIESLSFNDNCVLIRVRPGSAPGAPARVEQVPDLGIFDIRVEARTTSSGKRHKVIIERINGSDVVVVKGSVWQGAGEVESWVSVADPLRYFGAALRQGFADSGVEIAGEVGGVLALPSGSWSEVAVHRTDLLTTAEVINKRSQNFYAECLLKLMGARLCGRGSWPAGREVVAEFLEEVGISKGTYTLADGSGMSRNNKFTPRQVTTLLRYMFLHPRGPEFLLTLPFSGEENLRWESRLSREPYRGNVFAKTGSLTGVSTLSGFAKARSGKVYAFSLLFNRTTSNWRASRAQDDIVRALVDHG